MQRSVYFKNADGIRGLACLIVLVIHSCAMFFPTSAQYLRGSAKIGVWLFFVLSAFLLTNHLMAGDLTRSKIIDYVTGRLLRIMPLYVVAVIAYHLLGTAGIDSNLDVLNAITLRTGFAHLWTIPVEMKFYLLLIVMACPTVMVYRHFGERYAFLFVLSVAVFTAILFPARNTPENSIELRWYIPCFMAGMAIAVIKPSLKSYPWLCTSVNTLIFCGLVMTTNYFRILIGGPHDPSWLMNKFPPIAIAWSFVVAVNIDIGGIWSKFWNMPLLQATGKWSYSIYLFHWLIAMSLSYHHPQSYEYMALAIACSLFIGAVMHYMIERPMINLRHALTKKTKKT
jgi:peptidoglycan/LPS O-acetylase OafA/YrhL